MQSTVVFTAPEYNRRQTHQKCTSLCRERRFSVNNVQSFRATVQQHDSRNSKPHVCPYITSCMTSLSHLCTICTSVDAEGRSSHFRLFIASLLRVILTNSVSSAKL